MPYIKPERRLPIEPTHTKDVGELNYDFTTLIVYYLKQHGLSYQSVNDILGAFEGAKLEFYRRVVVPYEDKKIIENGDVYPDDLTS